MKINNTFLRSILAFSALILCGGLVNSQAVLNQKVTANGANRQVFYSFGHTLDGSGNTLVVGEEASGGFGNAYVYNEIAGLLNLNQELVIPGLPSSDDYGFEVAISGDYIMVGAPGDEKDSANINIEFKSGAIYAFKKNAGGFWQNTQRIKSNDRGPGDDFGSVIAIDGDWMVAGVSNHDFDENGINGLNGSGAAFVYKKNGSGIWNQTQMLVPFDRAELDFFGSSVAIKGNFLAIGAPFSNKNTIGTDSVDNAGAVYVYEYNASISKWQLRVKLFRNDRNEDEYFGSALSFVDSVLIATAPDENTNESNTNQITGAGAAYVYDRDNANWSLRQKIVSIDRTISGSFGSSVDVLEDKLIIGAAGEGSDSTGSNLVSRAGASYFYKENSGLYSLNAKLVADNRNTDDLFGSHSILLNNSAIVASPLNSLDSAEMNFINAAGAVYVYSTPIVCSAVYDTITDSVCAGDSVLFAGNYYKTAGFYSDTTVGIVNGGCDSISTLNLTAGSCANPCSELFFSTYIEGGTGQAGDKAVEIFNPTSNTIFLSNYSVKRFTNGSSTVSASVNLQDSILPYGVYVLANAGANASIVANQTSSVMGHNGDDAIVLYNGTTLIDIIGKIGEDPGTQWTAGGVSTKDQVLVRDSAVKVGQKDTSGVYDPSLEWSNFASTDFSHFGSHISACAPLGCVVYADTIFDTICIGDSSVLAGVSYYSAGIYSDTVAGTCDTIVVLILDTNITLTPTVFINAFGTDTLCFGDSVLIETAHFGTGLNPTFQWYKNGVAFSTLEDSLSLSFDSVANGDSLWLVVTASAEVCTDSQIAYSDTIQIYKTGIESNLITRIGDTLYAPVGAAYEWFIDSVSQPSETDQTLIIPTSGTSCYFVTVLDSNAICIIESEVYCNDSCTNLIDTITDTTICSTDSVMFAGNSYSSAGTYYDTNQSAAGCDSITVFVLATTSCQLDTVNCNELFISEYLEGTSNNKALEIYNPTNDSVDLSLYSISLYANGGSSVTVNIPLAGVVLSKEGHVLINASSGGGLQSKANQASTDLTFNGNDAIVLFKGTDTVDIFGSIGQNPGSAGWDGLTANMTLVRRPVVQIGVRSNPVTFTTATEWISTLVDDTTNLGAHESKCDSCLVVYYDSINETICAGDSSFFNGDTLTFSGSYYDTLSTTAGCDSIVELNLTVLDAIADTIYDTICAGDTLLFGNVAIDTAGVYTQVNSSITTGCDSITVLEVAYLSSVTVNISDSICAGDFYFFAGTAITTSGTYADTVANVNGCDSTTILSLLVVDPIFDTLIDTTICASGSVTFAGNVYNTTGVYYDTNQAASGCDSISLLNLVVTPNVTKLTADIICTGDSSLLGTVYYKASGIYNDTTTSAVTGCDSITTLVLTVLPTVVNVSDSICQGDSVLIGSTYVDTVGTYRDTTINSQGCDSITVLSLSFKDCSIDPCSELFFSEYVEGSASNKALEIYNPTPNTIFLANYTIDRYSNGGTTATTLTLTDSILSGDVYVLVGSSSAPVFTTKANAVVGLLNHNGDDTYVLRNNNQIIDIFGVIGQDPGTQWLGSGVSSKDQTLVRKVSVSKGINLNPSTFDPSLEWITNPIDDSTYLGFHQSGCIVCPPVYDSIAQIICQGDSIAFNGRFFNTTGAYVDTIALGMGCDSIVTLNLTVQAPVSVTIADSVCSGDSVLFAGVYYSTPGSYTDSSININGCDSITTLVLTNTTGFSINISDAICAGDSLLFGSTYLDTAGTYSDTVSIAGGCDSVTTLTLTVLSPVSTTIVDSICTGDTIMFAGNNITMAGTYTDTLATTNGCDSVITLQLSLTNGFFASITNTICAGDSILFGSRYVDTAGSYSDTITLASGCDSVTTLSLTVINNVTTTINDSICNGDTILFGSIVIDTTGTYRDTLANVNGCDSIVTLVVTNKTYNTKSIADSLCVGDSLLFGGVYISSTGTYTDTVSSVNSCDTVITLTLTNTSSLTPTISISAPTTNICSNQSLLFTSNSTFGGSSPVYQWTINGNSAATGATYNSLPGQLTNGDVVECYLVSSLSCANPDTVYSNSLTITIVASSLVTMSDTICQGETYFFNGDTLTSGGVYADTTVTAGGCDSVVELTLIVNSSPAVIANASEDTIGVNGTINFNPGAGSNAGNYNWDFGDGFLSTLDTVSHTFNAPGVYQVVLTGDNPTGCNGSDTIQVVVINDVAISEFENNSFVSVYPNPVSNELTIAYKGTNGGVNELSLYDSKGMLVLRKTFDNSIVNTTIDLSSFENGIYFINVIGDKINKNIKLSKFN